MARAPRATTSRDGRKRVTATVEFRMSWREAVNLFHWHISNRHVMGCDGEAELRKETPAALRKIVSEDLYLHGTIAFERDSEDWDDEFWTTAEELARRAYPGLEESD